MQVHARAPLRLGLGGGGTDLDAYSRRFGGCVVNVTIGLYAHCSLSSSSGEGALFRSFDRENNEEPLGLHRAVYRRVTSDWCGGEELPVMVETRCDVPPGSGLGASSSIVTAQLAAYGQYLGLRISSDHLARMAYQIEREDMSMSGGYQDQWASAYGGFNFFEFHPEGKISVSPLSLGGDFYRTLQDHLVLFDTGIRRRSQEISKMQMENTESGDPLILDSLHSLKADALFVREVLQKGDLVSFASSLRRSWEAKKHLADGISNFHLESIYNAAMDAGAMAGKVVGAGGGGFMLFLVSPERRNALSEALSLFSGRFLPVSFAPYGARAWFTHEEAGCRTALTH